MKTRLRLVLGLSLIGVFALSSCEESDDNKIAQAQECLNKLSDTSPSADIQACMDKVSGIETEQAYGILCSGSFLKGGLTTNKIVTAFDNADTQPAAQKEAKLIEGLSLTSTAVADQAYENCAKTNTPGLIYIASLVKIGTFINVLGTGGSIDAKIDDCIASPSTCQLAEVGEAIPTIANLYCKGDAKDEQVCKDLEAAIASAGGDYQQMAINLLNQFNY